MPSRRGERPDWYYRISRLVQERLSRGEANYWDDELPINFEDYDEDISDCSTFSCASRNGCKYDSQDECPYHRALDEDGSSSGWDSTASGSYIDYSEMKQERKERKRALREQKKRKDDEKKTKAQMKRRAQEVEESEEEGSEDDRRKRRKGSKRFKTYEEGTSNADLELEMGYVKEIKHALVRAQSTEKNQEKPAPLELGILRTFKLWSIDHVKHCPYELAPVKYIEFDNEDPDPLKYTEKQLLTMRADVSAHVYLLSQDVCKIDMFTPPKYLSTKTHELQTNNGPVYIQFFDNNYLTLKMSREMVFINHKGPIPKDAPPFFRILWYLRKLYG
ncbi:hypothetical protein IL306_013438 [Fusarium sp. DS 682]|nr:hypothetical protein IL306_013438 [Fusarium sp. DS 682]